MDGMLSQEEINALLAGGAFDTMDTADSDTPDEILSDDEKDAIGEICNISMGTAATTLYSLVGQRVDITTPHVECGTWDELLVGFENRPCVTLQIGYKEGLDGNNLMVLREQDVKVITDLMMGGDGTNTEGEISELHLSAIGEAMNQMMGSASTSLSSMLNKKVDISPPIASLIDLNDTLEGNDFSEFLRGQFVQVAFRMEIGDLIDSQIMQLYPFDFAKELYMKFVGGDIGGLPASGPIPVPAAQPVSAPVQQAQAAPPMMEQPMMQQSMMMQQPMMQQPIMQQPMMMPMQDVNVQQAQFQPFMPGISPLEQQENIDLIMDVPLEVTVELGRTNKSIKEILEFSPGVVIELNKRY